jgi:hypothetical protein
MKFELNYRILADGDGIDEQDLLKNFDAHRDKLVSPSAVEAALVMKVDGKELGTELFDPLLRLCDQWVRKLPWVLAGDTETLALRNSEHCYAFVPAGESVELSFFAGSETEIEDYVIEPFTIRLDVYAPRTIELADRVLALVARVDAALLDTDEDCKELRADLDEAKKAWREYQLRNKRR